MLSEVKGEQRTRSDIELFPKSSIINVKSHIPEGEWNIDLDSLEPYEVNNIVKIVDFLNQAEEGRAEVVRCIKEKSFSVKYEILSKYNKFGEFRRTEIQNTLISCKKVFLHLLSDELLEQIEEVRPENPTDIDIETARKFLEYFSRTNNYLLYDF